MDKKNDKEIFSLIDKELLRQQSHLELIASENFVSKDILNAQGSILTNKYAEGYPNNRYYGGCRYVDKIEEIAIKRITKLFNCKYANVQPYSGSIANASAYYALLKPGDKILAMKLDAGGHLTHGYKLSFSGRFYKAYHYGVNKETGLIDYEEVLKLAKEIKPKLIVCGASAYPRIIDFKKFRKIADEVGAYLMADVAHIAGLIVTGLHPNPFPHTHIVTSTTHKTLRGPRGGLILTNDLEISKKVDRSVFPGNQGGPLMHVIAAKAIAFKEANLQTFKKYQKQVIKNAKTLANEFIKMGYNVLTNGTDNHLLLINVKDKLNITGLKAEQVLDTVNITINKNSLPNDTEKPIYTSGIRIGTPALTTRGMKEKEMIFIANLINKALTNIDNKNELEKIKEEVIKLTDKFKIYEGI